MMVQLYSVYYIVDEGDIRGGGSTRGARLHQEHPLAPLMSVSIECTLVDVLVMGVGGDEGGPADSGDEFKIGPRTGVKYVPAPEKTPSLQTCRKMWTS